MPKKKEPFINKKKSVTFQLVHRSLRDPLAADVDAPQRVLLPFEAKTNFPDSISECGTYQHEEMLSERKKYGIGFEDDYDYMQHLKESTENQPAILIPNSKHALVEVEESEDGMSDVYRNNIPILKLPSEVFGSSVEEPIGLLYRAIPPSGPQPTWDPDIVAGIDDDFDFNNPDNHLEDHFVAMASQPLADDESDDVVDLDFGSDDNDYDETKSQFTNYSLTSSVIRRNDHLSLLDDKFERFFASYNDENIGDLSQFEIEGSFPVDDVNNMKEMESLLGIKQKEYVANIESATEWNKQYIEKITDPDPIEAHMVTLVKEEKNNWDCETILSTYSSIYNHPKLIQEPIKVQIRKKTGLPINNTAPLTKQQLKTLDFSVCELSKKNISNRRKYESKQEKLERKKAIKEAKKERRIEKKATKKAFQAEMLRQNQELINLRQNLTGIKIS